MPSAANRKNVIAVGLTGGFGTGKSTVLGMLKKKGARVLDADAVVHALFNDDAALVRRIGRRFPGAVSKDGRLDRKALAARVFARPAERKALERIVHPRVRARLRAELASVRAGVAVVDVPLLFESGWAKEFDAVIVVSASRKTRVRRLAARGFSAADVTRRSRAQWPLNKKRKLADFVVDNDGTVAGTKKQIDQIWERITNHANVVRGKNGRT